MVVGRPFKKGEGGRPKGVRNKATLIEAEVEAAFKECKGKQLLVEMARSGNPKREAIAWSVFQRLMRQKVEGDVPPGGVLAELLGRVQAAGKPT